MLTVDLQITLHSKTQKLTLGNQGPTKHLLHIESVTNPYSNLEESALCDVDFVLKGNPYLRKRL